MHAYVYQYTSIRIKVPASPDIHILPCLGVPAFKSCVVVLANFPAYI